MSRLLEQVEARVDFLDDGCWRWTGFVHPILGYGYFRPVKPGPNRLVHRLVYEALVEPLGALHLHHTYQNRACVNPDHLQPVTPGEHIHAEMELQGRDYLWQNRRRNQ